MAKLIEYLFNKGVDHINSIINPFVKFELVSRHTKVQASALQTFADVLLINKKKNFKFLTEKQWY